MTDQKLSYQLGQLITDVERLKKENQVLKEQFYNFVTEEHVSKSWKTLKPKYNKGSRTRTTQKKQAEISKTS